MRTSFYVVVRGPLGAGKSTISGRLAETLHGRHIPIDEILEAYDLERWDEDCISEGSFLDANVVAARRAEPALRRGVPVIFDGNFYWRSVVDDLVGRLPFPHLVVTLKVPLAICIARDAGRSPSYGPDAARDVYEKVAAFGYGVPVDATGTVGDAVTRVAHELRSRGLPGP